MRKSICWVKGFLSFLYDFFTSFFFFLVLINYYICGIGAFGEVHDTSESRKVGILEVY